MGKYFFFIIISMYTNKYLSPNNQNQKLYVYTHTEKIQSIELQKIYYKVTKHYNYNKY